MRGQELSTGTVLATHEHTALARATSGRPSAVLRHGEGAAQLERALGIEAVETSESGWDHRPRDGEESGAQIDLLIDRKDAAVNLCEMKFCESKFVVDKRYADELRRKRDVLRTVTATRKTVFITLVTTFGVADNKHRRAAVDVDIGMDALFLPS
jgi:uncharacterized protein